jgi:hypothetical protein
MTKKGNRVGYGKRLLRYILSDCNNVIKLGYHFEPEESIADVIEEHRFKTTVLIQKKTYIF